MSGGRAVLLLATMPTRDEAERVGEALVERRLAASGSVVPMVHTFSWSEGRLQRSHAALLIVTTTEERSEDTLAELVALHSGPKPEVVRLAVDGAAAGYLGWIAGEVAPRQG
ncbi:MAG: divalent-cation tolerance protein CutA [Candidatus Dormibacteraeota bacterium]|nr:divalent-cation tolerance protein CutA [Candidatus Dormibacteraeota bacterium]